MRSIARIGLATAALALVVVATAPLAVLIHMGAGLPAPLSADEATGTAWHGTLRNVRWHGQRLGDLRLGLRPLPLLLGRAQLRLAAPGFSVVAERGARQGFQSATGKLEYPLPWLPGALASIDTRHVDLLFADQRCLLAGGQVRATVQPALGDLPGLQLSGVPACAGADARLVLATDPGAALEVRVHWTVRHDGAYSARAEVRSEDPAARLALQLAGFQAGPEGLVRHQEGRFGSHPHW